MRLPTESQVERLAETYTELHEGLPPSRFRMERIPEKSRSVIFLGRITEIRYSKKVPHGVDKFYHPFAPHASPGWGVDERGILRIYAGRYHTTTHGVEDLPRHKQRPERLPGIPRETVELGRLDGFDYEWFEDGTWHHATESFSGSRRPLLVHDEHGDLHALRGRYHIEARTMARRHRRGHHSVHANPGHKRHGRKKSRRHHGFSMRRNPAEAVTRGPVGSMLMTSVIVIAGGTAAVAVGDILLNRTTLTPYQKGGAMIAGGLVLGGISAAMKAHPMVTAILALGPGIYGGVSIYQTWQASRLAAAAAPPAATPSASQATGANPGAQALPPGSYPQGYYGVNQGACAVGYR